MTLWAFQRGRQVSFRAIRGLKRPSTCPSVPRSASDLIGFNASLRDFSSGFQNQIYPVRNPRDPIRVRRRKNLSPNPLRFAPAAKLSAHTRRRHSTSQPTHNTTHAQCRLPHRSVMPVTVATNNILFHWIIFARVTHPLSVISTFVDVVIVEEEIQFLYRRICPSLPLTRHLVNTAENVIDYGLCLGFQMKQTSAACFVVSPSPLLC